MNCTECNHNNNGWCKKLNTNNKIVKQESCPYNKSEDKEVLEVVYGILVGFNANKEIVDKFKNIIDKM